MNIDKQIIGLDSDNNVYSGYDSKEREYCLGEGECRDNQELYEDATESATKEQKIALADAMIARWSAYKAKVLK